MSNKVARSSGSLALDSTRPAIDPPLEALFTSLRERKLIRLDVPVPRLVMTFKSIHLGLTALWAVEGPPFSQTEIAVRDALRMFCEGLRERR